MNDGRRAAMVERQPPAFLTNNEMTTNNLKQTKNKKQGEEPLTLAQRILLAIMFAFIVGVFALTFWNLYKEVYNV